MKNSAVLRPCIHIKLINQIKILIRHSGVGRNPAAMLILRELWIPAFAGMTISMNGFELVWRLSRLNPHFRHRIKQHHFLGIQHQLDALPCWRHNAGVDAGDDFGTVDFGVHHRVWPRWLGDFHFAFQRR